VVAERRRAELAFAQLLLVGKRGMARFAIERTASGSNPAAANFRA
jgi:hypothetical protein